MSRLFKTIKNTDNPRLKVLRRQLIERRRQTLREVQEHIAGTRITTVDEDGVAHGYTEEDDKAHGE